jgi:hypothetical protein
MSTNISADLRKPVHDLDVAFEEFKRLEQATWLEFEKHPNADHLVRPSGSLRSTIAHYLNEPSFTSDKISNGETADLTNGCIAMIMENAFQKGHTMIFDHLHRRSPRSEGLKEYPRSIIERHETFTRQICESIEAKVVILYGSKLQRRVLRDATFKFTILPLWDWLEGVFLFLDYESNYENADTMFRLRRVLLFAVHPQRVFYEPRGSATLTRQDKITLAAVQMAGGGINCTPDYYANKRWQKLIMGTLVLACARAAIDERILKEIDNDLQDPRPITSLEGAWSEYFNAAPHSNEQLRKLTIEALKTWQKGDEGEDWRDPSDFPEAVLHWFQGQRDILLRDQLAATPKDIVSALRHIASPALANNHLSLKETIYRIIENQHEMLSDEESDGRSSLNKRQDLWHSGFGQRLVICCEVCGSTREEQSSRWAVKRPGQYIARHLTCKSQECGEKKRWFKPQDENIPWVRSDVRTLELPERPISHAWKSCLRSKDGEALDLPTDVRSWCIRCQKDTLLTDNRQEYVDSTPQWTLGHTRPLYVERDPMCLRCKELRRANGRFVPIEPTIDSITKRNLQRFEELFGRYDNDIKARLLDQWPPSSRFPRSD